MFKAIISTVDKQDDLIRVDVKFTDGTTTFNKEYQFVSTADITTGFDQTIQDELKRINDLETGYQLLKTKVAKVVLMKVIKKVI